MKKTLFAGCLILLLLWVMLPLGLAAENEKDALSYSEIMDWVTPYIEKAKATTPLNAPIGADALNEDGYAYIYDFATMYFDKPTLDSTTKLNAIVIYTEEEALPRGVNVDSDLDQLLSAYYCENEELVGSKDFAYLYISDTMPMGAMWAWVQRDGQTVNLVQYAIHEQLSNGGDGYTDCGLLYTIQANTVVAVRAYGLSAFIDEKQVASNLNQVNQISKDDSYFMFKRSLSGSDVGKFSREDLSFSGLDFLSITPEECVAILGESMEDVWMENDTEGYLRNLNYEDCAFTFGYDINKENGTLLYMEIFASGMEGPRGVAIGDSLPDVMQRFMHSQGTYDGTVETLYGLEGDEQYATAEYWDGGETILRYSVDVGTAAPVTMQLYFDMNGLTTIMLYCW